MSGVYSVSTSEQDRQRMYISAPNYSTVDEPNFPVVPIAPGVDLSALTAGDPDPKFITRPLAILDEVSENGLPYNQAIFNDVYNQILTRRPVARQGHVAQEDKSSVFPPDAGYWIGAVIDSHVYGKPTVFGKAYLPPGPTRDLVLRRQATGTPLSNSLWGDITWAEDGNGNREPIGARIESIDFVPEERAALQALGGSFVVTSEMKDEETMADEAQEAAAAEMAQFQKKCAEMTPVALHEMMSAEQRRHCAESYLKECDSGKVYELLAEGQRSHIAEARMKEATPEETYKTLSEAARKGIVEAYCKETNSKLVPDEIHQIAETAVAEMKTVKTDMAELQKVVQRYQRQDFERALSVAIDGYFTAEIKLPKYKEQEANLKRTHTKSALAEMAGMDGGQTEANIEAAVKTVWETEVKGLAEMLYAAASGPAAVTGTGAVSAGGFRNGFNPNAGRMGRYDDDFVAQAARISGALGGRSGGVK